MKAPSRPFEQPKAITLEVWRWNITSCSWIPWVMREVIKKEGMGLPRQWVFHLCQITGAVRPGYDCTHVATSLKFKRFQLNMGRCRRKRLHRLSEGIRWDNSWERSHTAPYQWKICPREGLISKVKRVRSYEGILENISDIYSRNFI